MFVGTLRQNRPLADEQTDTEGLPNFQLDLGSPGKYNYHQIPPS